MKPIDLSRLTQLLNPPVESDRLRSLMPDPDSYGLERHEYLSIPGETIHPALFRLPAHRSVVEFWCRERDQAGTLPRSDHFDPAEVLPALGFLMILEPNPDASDFLYRLYGTHVAAHHGRDMTGRWLSSFDPPGPEVFGTQYRAAAEWRAAVYAEHDAVRQVSVITRWCRLALPMTGADGRVDRVVVCNVPIRRDATE